MSDAAAVTPTSGTANLAFAGSLSAPSATTITVQYSTADGTATTASGAYNLFSPKGASPGDAAGIGRLINPYGPIQIYAFDDFTYAPATGTTPDNLTILLSSAPSPGQTITVRYATANGTATTKDGDYLAASGIATFMAGQRSTTVTVNLGARATAEPVETYLLKLSSPTGASLAMANGVGMIINPG